MASRIETIAAQLITDLKTTSLVNAARGQIAKVSRYPVAELRFYGGGEIIYDFNSINRALLQLEIVIRGKTVEQVITALESVLVLWPVDGAKYTALRNLSAGFFDLLVTDWEIPDERQRGAEVIGIIMFDLRVEYSYT